VFIDPDKVESRNLATQRVLYQDVGSPKVDAAERIVKSINPDAVTLPLSEPIEAITDERFRELAFNTLAGGSVCHRTLLCGFTDSFQAQARVNRLSLNFAIPSLCGQMYKCGWGAEASLVYPGVTAACHRCMLASRYECYLNQAFTNDVGSFGSPIWSADRLNALLGELAMCLLHHNTGHARYGNRLVEIGNRTLIHVRLDPHLREHLNWGVFEKAFAGVDSRCLYYDETIWRPQDPDHPRFGRPRCPDCGGEGDLTKVAGTYEDTTQMRYKWVDV
jgi:hypothetical protein